MSTCKVLQAVRSGYPGKRVGKYIQDRFVALQATFEHAFTVPSPTSVCAAYLLWFTNNCSAAPRHPQARSAAPVLLWEALNMRVGQNVHSARRSSKIDMKLHIGARFQSLPMPRLLFWWALDDV
jgi:hypothetical protein